MKPTIAQSIARRAVDVLNEAFAADPKAILALCEHRVPCNEALGNHPTIQVVGTKDGPIVGLLGIVCGIVERQTEEKLCAVFEDDERTKLLGFSLLSEIEKLSEEKA